MIGKGLSIFLAGLAMVAGGPSLLETRTCEEQSGTTCQDCLGYDDIFIGDEPKQSDCAWFVPPGGEPQCISREKCDDEGGKCVVGLKSKPSRNNRRCKKAIKNTCESIKGCNNCLLGRNKKNNQGPFLECAYFVRGDEMRCIAESKCDDKGFEGGFCLVLPDNPINPKILLDPKPVCRDLKKKKTKKPTSEPTSPPDVLPTPFPKNCTEWPELLGWELIEAHIYLSNIYGNSPDVEIEVIGPDDFVTEDIRLNRIRLFHNEALTIIKIPRTEHSNCGGGAPLPKEGTEWPGLVGQGWEEAKEYLSNAYNALNITVTYEKDPVTSDYRLDRVFLFYDLEGKISVVPRVG